MLEREYPGVRFHHTDSHPPGLNAIIAGVLVGRYHSERDPAYGVLFAQPRSCGGRNQDQIMETDTQSFCRSAAPATLRAYCYAVRRGFFTHITGCAFTGRAGAPALANA